MGNKSPAPAEAVAATAAVGTVAATAAASRPRPTKRRKSLTEQGETLVVVNENTGNLADFAPKTRGTTPKKKNKRPAVEISHVAVNVDGWEAANNTQQRPTRRRRRRLEDIQLIESNSVPAPSRRHRARQHQQQLFPQQLEPLQTPTRATRRDSAASASSFRVEDAATTTTPESPRRSTSLISSPSSQCRRLIRLPHHTPTPSSTRRALYNEEEKPNDDNEQAVIRVGDDYQALVLPSLAAEDTTPAIEYDGTEGDVLWDPNQAAKRREEGRGKELDDFMDQGGELSVCMLLMEALHRGNYDTKAAMQEFYELHAQNPSVSVELNDKDQRKFLDLCRGAIIGKNKQFQQASQELRCRLETILVHYYRWKSSTKSGSRAYRATKRQRQSERDGDCKVCNDGGSLILCETCGGAYHLGCLNPPLTEVPEDDWYCDGCSKKRPSSSALKPQLHESTPPRRLRRLTPSRLDGSQATAVSRLELPDPELPHHAAASAENDTNLAYMPSLSPPAAMLPSDTASTPASRKRQRKSLSPGKKDRLRSIHKEFRHQEESEKATAAAASLPKQPPEGPVPSGMRWDPAKDCWVSVLPSSSAPNSAAPSVQDDDKDDGVAEATKDTSTEKDATGNRAGFLNYETSDSEASKKYRSSSSSSDDSSPKAEPDSEFEDDGDGSDDDDDDDNNNYEPEPELKQAKRPSKVFSPRPATNVAQPARPSAVPAPPGQPWPIVGGAAAPRNALQPLGLGFLHGQVLQQQGIPTGAGFLHGQAPQQQGIPTGPGFLHGQAPQQGRPIWMPYRQPPLHPGGPQLAPLQGQLALAQPRIQSGPRALPTNHYYFDIVLPNTRDGHLLGIREDWPEPTATGSSSGPAKIVFNGYLRGRNGEKGYAEERDLFRVNDEFFMIDSVYCQNQYSTVLAELKRPKIQSHTTIRVIRTQGAASSLSAVSTTNQGSDNSASAGAGDEAKISNPQAASGSTQATAGAALAEPIAGGNQVLAVDDDDDDDDDDVVVTRVRRLRKFDITLPITPMGFLMNIGKVDSKASKAEFLEYRQGPNGEIGHAERTNAFRKGDLFIMVDGVDCEGLSYRDIVELLTTQSSTGQKFMRVLRVEES